MSTVVTDFETARNLIFNEDKVSAEDRNYSNSFAIFNAGLLFTLVRQNRA